MSNFAGFEKSATGIWHRVVYRLVGLGCKGMVTLPWANFRNQAKGLVISCTLCDKGYHETMVVEILSVDPSGSLNVYLPP